MNRIQEAFAYFASKTGVRYFTWNGCVEVGAEFMAVYVGGMLIGRFSPDDIYMRNIILLGLDQDAHIHKGRLASAFGITDEYLRVLRNRVKTEGYESLPKKGPGGSEPKLSKNQRDKIENMFESGVSAVEAFRQVGKKGKVSYQTVWRMKSEWEKRQGMSRSEAASSTEEPRQLELSKIQKEREAVEAVTNSEAGTEEDFEDGEKIAGTPLRSGKMVQHVGGLMLVALVYSYGLHDAAIKGWEESQKWVERLRTAIDAVILALGIGQRCVEGVRRLETKSAPILLRTNHMPSESWVRRVIKRYADDMGGAKMHLRMTGVYLERARETEEGPAVFYVDNHMRPYTGKYTLRKGWRMQDKRVKPGATDYYVHDEDGRPVFRVDVPMHDALTDWLSPIMNLLRGGLGEEERILMAFDRGGAFPEQMAKLRDDGFEFVTYERKPYPLLSRTAFTESVTVDGEEILVHEERLKNLGKGRGRVRRISLLMSDGHQVNLLAVSEERAARLIEVMLGRWVQENGFKHGNERWGINQLDRRKVLSYTPDTIIPNPARHRLERALKLAREQEGRIRRELARIENNDSRKERFEEELKQSLELQAELEAQRPSLPKHARLEDTELSGELVHHESHYKTVLDTVRIACANAESELAIELSPHIAKGREAKKALANLFASPGDIRVNRKSISIMLRPTGRKDERKAFQKLCETVTTWNLILPGDPDHRSIRFVSQL